MTSDLWFGALPAREGCELRFLPDVSNFKRERKSHRLPHRVCFVISYLQKGDWLNPPSFTSKQTRHIFIALSLSAGGFSAFARACFLCGGNDGSLSTVGDGRTLLSQAEGFKHHGFLMGWEPDKLFSLALSMVMQLLRWVSVLKKVVLALGSDPKERFLRYTPTEEEEEESCKDKKKVRPNF